MANMNGPHYGDQDGVDDTFVTIEFNTGGGSTGNSVSLEELFINGVAGNARNGRSGQDRRPVTAVSSQDIIRLDHPRPDILRARNEYVDVTSNKDSDNFQGRAVSGRQSTGHFLPAGVGRLVRSPMDEGLQPAQRAHSVPLAISAGVGPPPTAAQHQHCLYCAGRPSMPFNLKNGTRLDFDRMVSSKSSSTLTGLGSCQPSTSSAQPGRAIRLTNTSSCSMRSGGAVALPNSSVISSQPRNSSSSILTCQTGKREPHSNLLDSACSSSSLICKHCGRCRCSACSTLRTLPSRWICNDSCLLSKESVVDVLSCMCCVKGCSYHLGANSDDHVDDGYCARHADDYAKPASSSLRICSCNSTNRFFRWSVLACAAICLPCFWCYLPLKACAAGVEALYGRYHDHGCRCDPNEEHSSSGPSRGRSPARSTKMDDTRRLKRKRSRTLPPELPSIAAAKAGSMGANKRSMGCRGSSEYS